MSPNPYSLHHRWSRASRLPSSNKQPHNPNFHPKGKQTKLGWETGHTWGLRIYDKNRAFGEDIGCLFGLQLYIQQLESQIRPMGPNQVLLDKPKFDTSSPSQSTLAPLSTHQILETMLQQSYLLLNTTNPNVIKSCWLYYNIAPPHTMKG